MVETAWRRIARLLQRVRLLFAPPRPVPAVAPLRVAAMHQRRNLAAFGLNLSNAGIEEERTEVCCELAEMEATALRQLAEAQENLEKIRALQKRAGCQSIRLN